MRSRLQPAFWGGLFIGIITALPFIGDLNACCCIWVIAGGVLTSYVLQDSTPLPITAADGALAGLLAGAIGAIISSVLAPIVSAIQGITPRDALESALSRGDLPPQIADALQQLQDVPAAAWFAASFFMTLIVYPIFAMLGALLGVAMFKRTPPPPPPGTVEILPPEEPPVH
jgi:hypothetical protein